MVFSSIPFVFFFLPIFLIFYFCFGRSSWVILVTSLLFYAVGEARYLPVLGAYILGNWLTGLALERWAFRKGLILGCGVAANLAGLVYYKYLGFLVEWLVSLVSGTFGAGTAPVHHAIPLGISFFTFQAISYLIDVYRGDVPAQRSLLKFATYKAMFPQLIAGPIVRYSEVAAELGERRVTLDRLEKGLTIFIAGLAQKVLIANNLGLPADQIFALSPDELSSSVAWLGVLCYTGQIYFDFCGYSNMAIGLGHMMGFTLPANFDRPYISQSVTEFWRRWHMTLSRWFRDYLYIPLGGNRGGLWRTYANLALVFVLCGFWHGANWTFIVWGAYYGVLLVIERAGFGRVLVRAWQPLRHLYLMLAVMFGWVLFRADTLPQAWRFAATMLRLKGGEGLPDAAPLEQFLNPLTIWVLAAAVVFSILPSTPTSFADLKSHTVRAHSLLFMLFRTAFLFFLFFLSTASLATGTYNPFIYFRF